MGILMDLSSTKPIDWRTITAALVDKIKVLEREAETNKVLLDIAEQQTKSLRETNIRLGTALGLEHDPTGRYDVVSDAEIFGERGSDE